MMQRIYGRCDLAKRALLSILCTTALISLCPSASHAAPQSDAGAWRNLGTQLLQPIAIESQLPNSSIPMALESDHRGFLWVGTQNGLARWDGVQFRIFNGGRAPGDLPDTQVETLHVDKAGRLWVGTLSAGLAAYDPKTDRFDVFSAKPGGLSHVAVHALADASNGDLWVGTEAGLDRLTPANGRVTHVSVNAEGSPAARAALAGGVTAIAAEANQVWIGTARGLLKLDLRTSAITLLPLQAAGETQIQTLLVDSSGQLWVGSNGSGAYVVGRDGSARAVPPTMKNGLTGSGMRVRALLELSPGEMWLGTYDDGVISVDAATLQGRRVRLGNGSLLYGDQNIRAMYRIPGGQVIIASNGAITRYDPDHPAFTTLMGGESPTAVLTERTPVFLMEDQRGKIWSGYINHGVDIIDARTGRVSHATPKASGLPGAPARQMVNGLDDVLLGTDVGLFRVGLDGRNGRRVTQPGRAQDARVQALSRDGARLWLGGQDGVWGYDLEAKDALRLAVTVPADRLTDRRTEVLLPDSSGSLWIGTANGLNRYDEHSGSVQRFEAPASKEDGPHGFISSLALDHRGRLWVTTFGNGVWVAESVAAARAHRFRQISVAEGLPNSNANKVLEDDQHMIWASTDSGLARIDPDTLHVQAFQVGEGVPVASFFYDAGLKTRAGDLLFGGRGGLEVVRPGLLQTRQRHPTLVVTEVRSHGHVLSGDPFLSLAPGASLRLPPGGGGFEVGFAALDYAAPERVRYAYRLLGATSQWTEVDANRRLASFTNLAPKTYQLEIRAFSPSGEWTSRTLRLPVTVTPAWDQTWWFHGLALLAAIGGVAALVMWRTAHLHRRRRELEQVVADRTQALQEQKDALETQAVELADARVRAEAMAQAKSDFLANMSHEIRTPLNGVVAVADLLARSSLPAKEREMAEIIRASGDTLQRLLSDILDMARIESGKIAIEIAPFQAGDMLRAVCGLSRLKCEEKSVQLRMDIRPDIDEVVLGDMVRVRQIVTNLLSNAVKFTDRGEIRLIAERLEDGRARFTVTDTGVGFDMADKAKVLGRFEQADSSITRRFGGTGLGLSICCNLAALMGGVLDCESVPDVGSRFWIDLPLEPTTATQATTHANDGTTAAFEGEALRILLADDHPTNRQVVQLMLEGGTADLTCVENGAQALERYRDGVFDLILMDMQMPVMDGLTALAEIRKHEAMHRLPRIPAIMLTANALPEHVAAASAAGADLHLAKPFTAAALFDSIDSALASAMEHHAAA